MKFTENSVLRRIASMTVALAMILSLAVVMPVTASAAGSENGKINLELMDSDFVPDLRDKTSALSDGATPASLEDSDPDEIVRVSIVVEGDSTLAAGFNAEDIAENTGAVTYRSELRMRQMNVADKIQTVTGSRLNVVWNLTLAANIISANVRRGDIEAIKGVDGVVDVYEETLYTAQKTENLSGPTMASSPVLTGSTEAWVSGFTGAGSKVAIIDTGIDPEHIAFDADALLYSYEKNGYDQSLLMTEDDVKAKYSELNMSDLAEYSSDIYYSEKIPVAFNYAGENTDPSHIGNGTDPHGSHVAGIAAANAYIPDGEGGFIDVTTLEDKASRVKGVAPDAQIFAMQVFTGGGAYESDYIAAVEDAVVLGADAVNLSLGSPKGFSHSDTISDILAEVADSGTVMSVSQGNEGAFADLTFPGELYNNDIGFNLGGSPGSYTDSLTVASVNNSDYVEETITIGNGETLAVYDDAADGTDYSAIPLYEAGDSFDYIFIDGTCTEEEVNYLSSLGIIEGKAVAVYRGDISFSEKANRLAAAGAKAIIIVNTDDEILRMDLSDYEYTAPVVSMTMSASLYFIEELEWLYEDDGNGNWISWYQPYEGETATFTVNVFGAASGDVIMSDFSSWGVPGSLELKPDVTAPGGNINSVLGANSDVEEGIDTTDHDQYIGMSGTSMAAPHITGMAAVIGQYVRESGLAEKLGLSPRAVTQSLLMSTATPAKDPYNAGGYYPVIYQGAGIANVGAAVSADAFIMMNADANDSYADGKVKVELGDDPSKTGVYDFSFTVTNTGDNTNSYTFNTDLFTQAIEGDYLSKKTASIPATVTYSVDGVPFEVVASIEADVDKDGDTDEYDAMALLEYLVGNRDASGLDLEAGDVDGDGKASTYDAHLILAGLGTRVALEAGEKVEVKVHIVVPAEFFEDYENGAYIEGYTKVTAEATDEGVLDVDYSIPILGFYGSWTDASMYEPMTAIERIYDTEPHYNYAGATIYAGGISIPYNGLFTYFDAETGDEYFVMGNPFGVEDEFPADKLALRSTDILNEINYALIRNASDVAVYVENEAGEKVWLSTEADVRSVYPSNGSLTNAYETAKVRSTLGAMGVEEGEKVTIGVTAVPEYYMKGKDHDEKALVDVIDSGVLGDGATLTYDFTVDDTAPVITGASISIDPETAGDLSFTVEDNENVAFVAVLRRSEVYQFASQLGGSNKVEMTVTAEELEGAGEFLLLYAADYAGNVTAKLVKFGGEAVAPSNTVIGYDASTYQWSEYDPDTVAEVSEGWNMYYQGVTPFAPANGDPMSAIPVYTAAYYDGFVFFVGQLGDGTTTALYAASVNEPDYIYEVVDLPGMGVDQVTAIAYDEADEALVALNSDSTGMYSEVYMIDPVIGDAYLLGAVASYDYLVPFTSLAIDGDGVCYADVPSNEYATQGELYTFTLGDAWLYYNAAGLPAPAESLEAVHAEPLDGHLPFTTMVYDNDNDCIYAAGSVDMFFFAYSTLYKYDVATNTINYSNPAEDTDTVTNSSIPTTYGLCILPENTETVNFKPTTEAEGISAPASLSVLVGESYTVNAKAYPWTLELSGPDGYPVSTCDVEWTSNDPTIVAANGSVITGLKKGTTTIIGHSVASPEIVTDPVTVTVTSAPDYELKGFVYGVDGATSWASINASDPESYVSVKDVDYDVYAGSNSGELEDGSQVIYAQDGGNIIKIDPNTFEVLEESGAIMYAELLYSDMAEIPYPVGYMFPQMDGVSPTEYVAIGSEGDFVFFGSLAGVNDGYGVSSLSSEFGSPMVGIAFECLAYLDSAHTSIGAIYAIICEDGTIHELVFGLTGDYAGGIYLGNTVYETGIQNVGASDFYGSNADTLNAFGSLYYDLGDVNDPADDVILYSVYNTSIDPDHALLYYIKLDEENGEAHVSVAPEGFGYDIWPVTALTNSNSAAKADMNNVTRTVTVNTLKSLSLSNIAPEQTHALTAPVKPSRGFFGAPVMPDAPVVPTVPETAEEPAAPAEETPAETPAEDNAPAEEAPVEPTDAAVVGSINKVEVVGDSTAKNSQYVDPKNHTVTVQVKVTDVTNGLFEVTYDASLLKLTKSETHAYYSDINIDETKGVVKFAYASADAESGSVLDLIFAYDPVNTYANFGDVVIKTLEENAPGEEPADVVIPVDPDKANPVEHTHLFRVLSDANSHWTQCVSCGMIVSARLPHTFVDGRCTTCGYIMSGYVYPDASGAIVPETDEADDLVDVDIPVEAKFTADSAETVR